MELAATKECESKSRPAEHPTAPNPVDEILDIFGKKKQRSESATAEGLDISKWQKPAFVQTQSLQINPAFYGDSCIAHMC